MGHHANVVVCCKDPLAGLGFVKFGCDTPKTTPSLPLIAIDVLQHSKNTQATWHGMAHNTHTHDFGAVMTPYPLFSTALEALFYLKDTAIW